MANYEKLIFNTDIPYREPNAGNVLIAQPFLEDESFRHSVIQLIDKDEKGNFSGVVLNRPSSTKLSDVIENIILTNCNPAVHIGGPVGLDTLIFLHNLGPLITNSRLITDNLYLGGKLDDAIDFLNTSENPESHIRFFIGYSGWHAHQLQQEIDDHSWAVLPSLPKELIFKEGVNSYWHRIVHLLGDDFKSWLYHPMNPTYN